MGNLKKFVGEHAYNIIKNITVDSDAIRNALITPQNARAVFEDLNEFEIKALCTEINNSNTLGQIKETTQEEIVEAFGLAGYNKVIFDNEAEILECEKYYKSGEVICTYNNLRGRMKEYFMLIAVKKNIDKIERAKDPQRDDEYGTSILNIQIARNGSHMSIKNRYNHTVSQPDSTLNNNLDILYPELQSMVLGYYGFASMKSKKAHYNNIVNINNVYLKYHTERNNVYFGAFILDGVNGVRFTDTSRYYITGKETKNDHYNEPLVLDYKDKKAIDPAQVEKQMINGKIPLLTRALREGVLSSSNKEKTDNLIAVFQDAGKELLLSNKNALKFIHEGYGYDFTKPYKVTGFLGKFTAKSIEKATGSNNGILLIYSRKEMLVCVMRNGKFYTKDLPRIYYYNITMLYNQGDFETVRKSVNTAMYFIQQEHQYIKEPKQIERSYYTYYESSIYDKSGYNLTVTRNNLDRRLNKYKVEKRAKEAADVDFSEDIIKISNSFAKLKMEIITYLTKAKTTSDYEVINNVTNYELTWLVRDIENIKKHAEEKSFASIESARNMIENVKKQIKELKLKLA